MTEKKNKQSHNDNESNRSSSSSQSQEDDQEEPKQSSANEGFLEDQETDLEFLESATNFHVGRNEITCSVALKTKKKKKTKALMEFRSKIEDAIVGNYILGKPKNTSPIESSSQAEEVKKISLWGVPLLPSKGHQGTDIVLLKFLRARDFKVNDAFEMLRRTLKWRKEFKADEIVDENLGSDDLENVVFLGSVDKQGHPLCFTVYGPLKDRELYDKTFGSEEKRQAFLRRRVQFLEKGIKKLSFENGGVDSLVHITDLKNSPGPDMKELRSLSTRTLVLLQDNYPEIIEKNIVINAPLWYYVVHVLRRRMLSQRTKKKFVFSRPSNVTKTLLKFIAPEELPIQYGGLKRDEDCEFTPQDRASRLTVKASTTTYIEISVSEGGLTMVWDVTVVGWDVHYKEEFIPNDEGSYKILLQEKKRLCQSVRNSFYISEPGKIVITIDNWTFKNKKVLYRSKAKPTLPLYLYFNR